MPGHRLLVAYNGAGFSGYQVQPGERTVQGVLTEALSQVAREPVSLRSAGRTDAGVHALGQVVSFETSREVDADLMRAMAGLLPADVSVLDAQQESEKFDARHSARWRAYVYLIWNHPAPHPLYRPYSLWLREDIDPRLMREALSILTGAHDFSSFARVRPDQSPTRTVYEASCVADERFIRVRMAADGFLHQMVRSAVGSALEVARGRRSPGWMREVLMARDRAAAGPVAPAHGLTLTEVGYDDAPWPRRAPLGWPWAAPGSAPDQAVGGIR